MLGTSTVQQELGDVFMTMSLGRVLEEEEDGGIKLYLSGDTELYAAAAFCICLFFDDEALEAGVAEHKPSGRPSSFMSVCSLLVKLRSVLWLRDKVDILRQLVDVQLLELRTRFDDSQTSDVMFVARNDGDA